MRALLRSSRTVVLAAVLLALVPPGLAPAAEAPDFSGWQQLLDHYLVRLGDGRKAPVETRFDYEQLYVDEGIWTKKRSDRLEALHAQICSVRPSELAPKARLAWAINAYDFLVVERATMLLLVPFRQFQRYESVDQMTSADGEFFRAKVAEIEGRAYSLAEFERRFVYGDTTSMLARRPAGDPRLMFALCQGTIGGPSLQPRAFRPESLDVQLARAAREALSLPHILRWDAATHQVLASNLLGERLQDFGGTGKGIVTFAEKYGPPSLRAQLQAGKPADVTRFLPEDRKLNQVDRPKSPAPPAHAPGTDS